jgi:chromosome partitioning protein
MLISPRHETLNKIVILNPKGGCGKSTLATNLAAFYARQDSTPTVMDFDPQGSTISWLKRRPEDLPPIHGIAAYKKTMQATRSWQLRLPDDTRDVIVDTPAGISHDEMREITRDSTRILVPVLPSSMDMDIASCCIANLLSVANVDHKDRKLAVVANRTRKNTKSLDRLMCFLDSLDIPVIAVLRDSQNFVEAAEQGMGLHDMHPAQVHSDLEQFERIVRWLDARTERRQTTADVTEIRRRSFSQVSFLNRRQADSA